MKSARIVALLAGCLAAWAAACPVDTEPRADGVLLTVQALDGRITRWSAAQLRSLGVKTWTERRHIERGGAASEELAIGYDGVRLCARCALRVRKLP